MGSGTLLSDAQLRYCLAQGIRITAVRPLLDRTKVDEVAYLNEMVADFNKRCAAQRYPVPALEEAKGVVEANRPLIQAEARSAFGKRFATATAAAARPPIEAPKQAEPQQPLPEPAKQAAAPPRAETPKPQPDIPQPSPQADQKPSTPQPSPAAAAEQKASTPQPGPAAAAEQKASTPPQPAQPEVAQASPAASGQDRPVPSVEPSAKPSPAPDTKPGATAQPSSPAGPAQTATPATVEAQPEQRARPDTPAAAAAAKPSAAPPAPAQAPAPAPTPSVAAAEASEAQAPGSQAGTQEPPASKPTPRTGAQVAAVKDPALDRYTREIQRAGSRVLTEPDYPPQAKGKGLKGTAQIEVRFAAGGYIRSILLSESCGDAALDDKALEVARAVKFPYVPKGLQSREFNVRFPIEFRPRKR